MRPSAVFTQMTSELNRLTIAEASARLRRREISSRELTRACLDRVAAVEPRLNAFITVTADEALHQPKLADRRLDQGYAPALCGIPLAIKDIYCTRGVRTTCASKILDNFVPPFDATTIARLRAAGAVFVGKANLDEFAMGSSTENSAYGATRTASSASRAGHPAAQRRRSPRTSAWLRSAPTRAAQSACLPRTAAWWESSRPTAA